MRYILLIGLLFVFTGCESNVSETDKSGQTQLISIPERTVEIRSADDIFVLFAELHYTRKEWTEGSRLVPRIYMAGIPARWREASGKLTVAKKKELFFRLLAPLVLHANEVIAKDRSRLLGLGTDFDSLRPADQKWLLELAKSYKVAAPDAAVLTSENIAELRVRVDVIPVSLALAQGAEESGWATSRFAVLGNSLFGQWDFSGKGIKPERQRKELGDYGLARFDTPLDSVIAYMRNLNTHRAYQSLRDYRAELRSRSEEVTGYALATKLDKYSERGQKYVDGLHAIMRVNHLAPTDQARLSDKEIIYLVHKAE
jgi:uncharacterized FlgJ-related protein